MASANAGGSWRGMPSVTAPDFLSGEDEFFKPFPNLSCASLNPFARTKCVAERRKGKERKKASVGESEKRTYSVVYDATLKRKKKKQSLKRMSG
jgi:hypothetical protein